MNKTAQNEQFLSKLGVWLQRESGVDLSDIYVWRMIRTVTVPPTGVIVSLILPIYLRTLALGWTFHVPAGGGDANAPNAPPTHTPTALPANWLWGEKSVYQTGTPWARKTGARETGIFKPLKHRPIVYI